MWILGFSGVGPTVIWKNRDDIPPFTTQWNAFKIWRRTYRTHVLPVGQCKVLWTAAIFGKHRVFLKIFLWANRLHTLGFCGTGGTTKRYTMGLIGEPEDYQKSPCPVLWIAFLVIGDMPKLVHRKLFKTWKAQLSMVIRLQQGPPYRYMKRQTWHPAFHYTLQWKSVDCC